MTHRRHPPAQSGSHQIRAKLRKTSPKAVRPRKQGYPNPAYVHPVPIVKERFPSPHALTIYLIRPQVNS